MLELKEMSQDEMIETMGGSPSRPVDDGMSQKPTGQAPTQITQAQADKQRNDAMKSTQTNLPSTLSTAVELIKVTETLWNSQRNK